MQNMWLVDQACGLYGWTSAKLFFSVSAFLALLSQDFQTCREIKSNIQPSWPKNLGLQRIDIYK